MTRGAKKGCRECSEDQLIKLSNRSQQAAALAATHCSRPHHIIAALAVLALRTTMVVSEDGGVVSELQSRHGHSAQPESQQVLAVLQAVLEVISAQSMSATPTTIFAALMSALERPDAHASPVVSCLWSAAPAAAHATAAAVTYRRRQQQQQS